jgi:hypothetical protein
MKHRSHLALAALTLSLIAPDALAQRARRRRTPPPDTTPATPTAQADESEQHFRRGLQLATERNYIAALVEFRRAYEISRNELLRFNIAAVEVELNHYDEGLASLEAYERSAPAEVVRARAVQLQQLRERILGRSGTIRVPQELPGMRIECVAIGADTRIIREGAAGRAGIRVPLGRYRVTLSAPGHRPNEREFDVASGSVVTLSEPLEAMETSVTVRSNVEDAEVRIDGRLVGRTPIAPIPVSEGTHRIEVSRAGYTRFEISAFTLGTVSAVAANLFWQRGLTADEAGRVALDNDYPDVECTLDGERVDCTGTDFVPPGRHVFRATGRDWVTQERRVELAPGRVTYVPMTLAARPEARRDSLDRQWAQRRSGLIIGGLGLSVGALGFLWAAGALRDLGTLNTQQSGYFNVLLDCGIALDSRAVTPALLQCVQRGVGANFQYPLVTPMDTVDALESFETTRSGTLLGLGFATALVGVGAIGLITGTVVFFTAPGDRFATVPPRRARALAFSPTANGFALSF